jgi:hypothetical protein
VAPFKVMSAIDDQLSKASLTMMKVKKKDGIEELHRAFNYMSTIVLRVEYSMERGSLNIRARSGKTMCRTRTEISQGGARGREPAFAITGMKWVAKGKARASS